jgi:ribosomal protein S18 acetylase RimI-like enzyme
MMWHAMSGPQRDISEGDERARRYPVDVGPFSALPDELTADDYRALGDLVGPGNVALLFRGEASAPEGWEVLGTIDGVQMIGPTSPVVPTNDSRIVTLGPEDVEEMVSLTSRTKPGPFAPRTHELGVYLGIRVDGRLVSMAGQRAQTNEYIEISAVCTDEEFIGRGLGRALINAQIEAITAAGKAPMLHTSAGNARAIALYEHLGFQHRRKVGGVLMRVPQDTGVI